MVELIRYCTIAGSTVAELPYGQDEEHPDCIALKLALTERIAELSQQGVCDFFSNCEYGFSLLATEVIVVIQTFSVTPMRLHIVIPHEGQANR